MPTMKLWLCVLGLALAGVSAQYSSSAVKLRERMKLISGGGAPPATRPPAPRAASPYMEIVYSEPKLEGPYLSDAGWNPRGMGELYSTTRLFLGWILNSQAYPESKILTTS